MLNIRNMCLVAISFGGHRKLVGGHRQINEEIDLGSLENYQ